MSPPRPAPDAGAPAPVFLHIGAMKTGTTYLQRVLKHNKHAMLEQGFLFPGDSWKFQVRAAEDVLNAVPDDPVIERAASGAWAELAAQVRGHDGVASVVSMEFLSHAWPRHARAALEALEPAQVHIVLGVRDAARIIPAQWQTSVRSSKTHSWHDFRSSVRRSAGLRARLPVFSDDTAVRFRRNQDVARMLDVWAAVVPPERLHVITVPPSGGDPTLLWRRFAAVTGLDPELGESVDRVNESLGFASTELIRRVNLQLGPHVRPVDYNDTIRHKLSAHILTPYSERESRPLLDQATLDFALGWNARTVKAVTAAGARVEGSLDDLPTSATEAHLAQVDDEQPPPSEAELVGAAQAALGGLHDLIEQRAARVSKKGIDVTELLERARRIDDRWSGPDQADQATRDVAALCEIAMEIRRRRRDS